VHQTLFLPAYPLDFVFYDVNPLFEPLDRVGHYFKSVLFVKQDVIIFELDRAHTPEIGRVVVGDCQHDPVVVK